MRRGEAYCSHMVEETWSQRRKSRPTMRRGRSRFTRDNLRNPMNRKPNYYAQCQLTNNRASRIFVVVECFVDVVVEKAEALYKDPCRSSLYGRGKLLQSCGSQLPSLACEASPDVSIKQQLRVLIALFYQQSTIQQYL